MIRIKRRKKRFTSERLSNTKFVLKTEKDHLYDRNSNTSKYCSINDTLVVRYLYSYQRRPSWMECEAYLSRSQKSLQLIKRPDMYPVKILCIGGIKVNNKNKINVWEHRRGNHKWTTQRNWQHRAHKTKKNTKKHNTICAGHHYAQANTNNVNMTRTLLQTWDKYGPNTVFMLKSQRATQYGTQNTSTHNRKTQKTQNMSNTKGNR